MYFVEISRVNVPMGGSLEVFASQEEYEPQQFNYAKVRKAAYRGSMKIDRSDCMIIIILS